MSSGEPEWSMNEHDVAWGKIHTARGLPAGGALYAYPQIEPPTPGYVMIHVPTGICVQGHIPEGDYSPTQMKEAKHRLRTSLWTELEELVAKELHVRRQESRG